MASFAHEQLTMAVHRFGHGPVHLLAFHGFGRTGHDFALLSAPLKELCTIHAFDLPFHGGSPPLAQDEPVHPEAWAAFFVAYARQINARQVGLLGYSLGGRLALCLLERQPTLVDQAFLAAPDGLISRPWYRGLAHHRPGRWLYHHFINHPGATHATISTLHRLGLVDSRMHRFIMDRTATPQARALLHQVWTGFRLIEPRLDRVGRNLREQDIPVHLLLGLHDRVIKPAMGGRLRHAAPDQVHLHLLPTGHRMMNEATGTKVASLITAPHGPRPMTGP
ncbi:MAG: alpha/beta hydrolase [Flavobacteriales bacterium]|nr:alpha/beta hydrolase [Flavobacteriales bacterium]MBP9079505.1 alpha/beta hydrolase [Flavobacteriales bacterium]